MPFPSQFATEPTPSPNTHDLGDVVRVAGVFRDLDTEDLDPIDPTVVKLSILTPSEDLETYIYDTDPEVVRDSEGHYHADIEATEPGVWYYRWFSEGTGQAADEGSYTIEAHHAVEP